MRINTLLFTLIRCLGMICCLLAPYNSHADDYQVELLLFETRQITLPAAAAEISKETALPDTSAARVLSPGSGNRAFELLPPEHYHLTALANRLQDATSYRLLTHMAWYQPLSTELTQIRLVDTFNNLTGNNLSGYNSRFTTAATPTFTGVIRLYNDNGTQVEVDIASAEMQPNQFTNTPAIYRLTEKRQLKANEIHYFDHPKLGVIVQLTPVAMTPPASP